MVRPNLVDDKVYNSVVKSFITSDNEIISLRFNVLLIVFILMGIFLVYFIYLDKSKEH